MVKKFQIFIGLVPVIAAGLFTTVFFLSCDKERPASSSASDEPVRLVVYTSMKQGIMDTIEAAFEKAYPAVDLLYLMEEAITISSRIVSENLGHHILPDMVWSSDPLGFYQMKAANMLIDYQPKNAAGIYNLVKETAGNSFFPARYALMGIAYNTNEIETPPKTWSDVLAPAYKDRFLIADPEMSGTSFIGLAMLAKKYGSEFFSALHSNGAKMGLTSSNVVDLTADGEAAGCLAVDYIVHGRIVNGKPLGVTFPEETLIFPTLAGILRDTVHFEEAALFMEFLLSKEGQTLIAKNGTYPARRDIPMPKEFNLLSFEDAINRAIPIDYEQLINERGQFITGLKQIMQTPQ
jgi:iron(III) transport system substrate-binding protein